VIVNGCGLIVSVAANAGTYTIIPSNQMSSNYAINYGSIAFGGNSQGAVNVGTYTISPSGQTSSNYAITYVNGTLTITPPPITFVLDALGTAANAAGTTAPSTVMNATVLPSPTSLPGNVSFGSNMVLPYGNAAGVVGGSASQQTSNTSAEGTSQPTSAANTNQQTSNSANTSQQTSKKRNGSANQQTSNKRNGSTKQQTNKRNGSTNQQTSAIGDRGTN